MQDQNSQYSNNCKCGKQVEHRRLRLCSTCYIIKRREDFKLREKERQTKDPGRADKRKKAARDLYYSKYRPIRLVKKQCRCGNEAPSRSKYSLCVECAQKHNANYKIKYQGNRKKNHVPTKIRENIKSRFKSAIKTRKSGSIVKYLGCSMADYCLYLESRFQPGMTWENYGSWHIDHVVPLSTDYDDLSLHHFSNTQPLWKDEHVRKTAIENGR